MAGSFPWLVLGYITDFGRRLWCDVCHSAHSTAANSVEANRATSFLQRPRNLSEKVCTLFQLYVGLIVPIIIGWLMLSRERLYDTYSRHLDSREWKKMKLEFLRFNLAYERLTDAETQAEWKARSLFVTSHTFALIEVVSLVAACLGWSLLLCRVYRLVFRPILSKRTLQRPNSQIILAHCQTLINSNFFVLVCIMTLAMTTIFWGLRMEKMASILDDPHRVLEIPSNATRKEIKRAYRSLILKRSVEYGFGD